MVLKMRPAHIFIQRKNAKLGQKGSRDLVLEFWDPSFHISGTVEDRNFKFRAADWPLAVLNKKMQS